MLTLKKFVLALVVINLAVFGYYWTSSLQHGHDSLPLIELVSLPEQAGVDAVVYSEKDAIEIREADEPQPKLPPTVPQAIEIKQVKAPAFVSECRLIGPVTTDKIVADIPEPAQRVTIESVRSGKYWVYLGPYETVAAARESWGEISARLDIDGAVLARGSLARHISLGLLATEARAKVMLDERIAQGLDAKMKRLDKREPVIWLKWVTTPNGLSVEEMKSLLLEKGHNLIKLKLCS